MDPDFWCSWLLMVQWDLNIHRSLVPGLPADTKKKKKTRFHKSLYKNGIVLFRLDHFIHEGSIPATPLDTEMCGCSNPQIWSHPTFWTQLDRHSPQILGCYFFKANRGHVGSPVASECPSREWGNPTKQKTLLLLGEISDFLSDWVFFWGGGQEHILV